MKNYQQSVFTNVNIHHILFFMPVKRKGVIHLYK